MTENPDLSQIFLIRLLREERGGTAGSVRLQSSEERGDAALRIGGDKKKGMPVVTVRNEKNEYSLPLDTINT